MLVKELIKKLEKLIEDNEPHKEVLGEAVIQIDIFAESEIPNKYDYKGISPDIVIDITRDGCYHILTAFELPIKGK